MIHLISKKAETLDNVFISISLPCGEETYNLSSEIFRTLDELGLRASILNNDDSSVRPSKLDT